MQRAVAPGALQLVGRHRHGGETGGERRCLGAVEVESIGPQAVVADHLRHQRHQPDRALGLGHPGAPGEVAGDHREARRQVEGGGGIVGGERLAGAQEPVRGGVAQAARLAPRRLGAGGLAQQGRVARPGGGVPAGIGAGQGSGAIVLVEAERGHRAVLELLGQGREGRGIALPVVEGPLERRYHDEGVGGASQVARDNDEAAVAAVLEAGELHSASLLSPAVAGVRACRDGRPAARFVGHVGPSWTAPAAEATAGEGFPSVRSSRGRGRG